MISVKDLKFTYPGGTDSTLRGLSFDIEKKEIFGFLGPSGAGKSTTQKILYGLLKDYQGSVEIMGKQIKEWDSELYKKIGICFELPNHYSMLTAKENLEFFQSLYPETRSIDEVLEWVGLSDAADRRISDFSKGMKVRLNIARSILHKPEMLFLDEPTSGLDPVNARNIKDLVLRLRDEGTTVFITTHNMMVADELCDRVAFITKGLINNIDSPKELKKKYGKRTLVMEYSDEDTIKQCETDLDDLKGNPQFMDIINTGKRIESVHSQETTLEKIFIEVTGKSLTGSEPENGEGK